MYTSFNAGDVWLNIDGNSFAVIDNSGDGWVSYIFNMKKLETLSTEDFLLLFYPCNPEKALDQL